MSNAVSIAWAELIMLKRNKTVAASAFMLPALFAGIFIAMRNALEVRGAVVAMTVVMMSVTGVYITATTTLADRRQSLYLKRLRTTNAGRGSIFGGMIGPVVVVNLVQIAAIVAVLGLIVGWPEQPLLFVVAAGALQILSSGAALATAVITRSASHAQITTLPIFFAVFGVSMWTGVVGADSVLVNIVPGGPSTQALTGAWTGGELAPFTISCLTTIAWGLAFIGVGATRFDWDPRR